MEQSLAVNTRYVIISNAIINMIIIFHIHTNILQDV